jgi:anti-sigma B factor antagonist
MAKSSFVEEFGVRFQDGLVAVDLPARLDVTNTRTFVDALQRELDSDHLQIILNFEKTQAIDSTALGAIVQVFKTLKSRDGTLGLCSVGSGVRRVLAITRVDRVFPIFDDLETALRAFATG